MVQAADFEISEATHHAYTIGLAHRAAGTLHLLAGDWPKARSLLEHGVSVLRAGNVSLSLPPTVTGAAWALAQLREASEALNRLRKAEHAVAGHATAGMLRAWDDHMLGRTYLLFGRLDAARRFGERAVALFSSQPGGVAHALHLLGDIAAHPDGLGVARAEAC